MKSFSHTIILVLHLGWNLNLGAKERNVYHLSLLVYLSGGCAVILTVVQNPGLLCGLTKSFCTTVKNKSCVILDVVGDDCHLVASCLFSFTNHIFKIIKAGSWYLHVQGCWLASAASEICCLN